MNDVILALSPHTDDIEFGCGGTLARLIEEGCEVHCAVFSICRESVPPGFENDVLAKECSASMSTFGLTEEQLTIFDYPVRNFPAHRQEILEDMLLLRKRIAPTLVFAPSLHDIHQDHHTIAEEAARAFKFGKLLGYEMGWNNLTFNNQVFYKLEQRHIEAKVSALEKYESQKFRKYSNGDTIRALAHARGVQISCDAAEVFELVRWII